LHQTGCGYGWEEYPAYMMVLLILLSMIPPVLYGLIFPLNLRKELGLFLGWLLVAASIIVGLYYGGVINSKGLPALEGIFFAGNHYALIVYPVFAVWLKLPAYLGGGRSASNSFMESAATMDRKLQKTLASRDMYLGFRRWAAGDLTLGNLLLYEKCRYIRKKYLRRRSLGHDHANALEELESVYHDFFAEGAGFEVDISQATKDEIRHAFSTGILSTDVFVHAELEIREVIRSRMFPRYYRTLGVEEF